MTKRRLESQVQDRSRKRNIFRSKRMIAFVVLLFYVAGVVSAIHAALYTRTAQGAIAWSVSLVSMPMVAVPAYLVFGRNKFEGFAQAYTQRQAEVDEVRAQYLRNIEPWQVAPDSAPSWYGAVSRASDSTMVTANSAELLIDGEATFASILEGIAGARDYVLLQFYMIHDDGLGNRVKDALIERAQSGVDVIVLYDEVGSSGLPETYVRQLRDAGIEVSSFKPTQGWRNNFQLNFRNHRKIVVVDGRVAWLGGHNVGDEYLGLDPAFSPWRDTHVRLEGPAALQAQLTVLADWYWATREIPDVSWMPRPAEGSRNTPVMVLPTGPVGDLEVASLFFVAALNVARERIWLSAPYFVPDEAVMKALQLAALRGVDVRIITTGKPDSLPVYLAAFHYIRELSGLGIKFYAYQPGFLHEKVMLIDDNISAVGTHNFDNRSFRLNFEVTSVIVDQDFARSMEAMLEADFAHANVIDSGAWEDRPLWWRIAVRLARLAAPVL